MSRLREIAGTSAVAIALALLPISAAALAHGAKNGQADEFYKHMDVYAGNINHLIASVEDIVAGYEPADNYKEELDSLVQQWESVGFHEAVETNAMALYPPVWAAIGAFSTAIKEDAPIETVRAKADAIAAALWQGYGALKLLAARDGDCLADDDKHEDEESEHEHHAAQADGEDVIDTINDNLDKVLALYKQSKNEAARDLIYNTYMNYFEGIEGDLIEQNAQLVANLEADFNATLPGLIKSDAPASEVAAQIDAMQADLEKAADLLEAAEEQETAVF